jgi:hypothetical protein
VQYVLEDIMAKSKIPGSTLTPEQASKMVVRACQAIKKDVLDEKVAFLRKEKKLIKAFYLARMIEFKKEITETIDLTMFHKFSMILH